MTESKAIEILMVCKCFLCTSSGDPLFTGEKRDLDFYGILFWSLSVLQDTSILQEASLRDAQQVTTFQLPPVSDFWSSHSWALVLGTCVSVSIMHCDGCWAYMTPRRWNSYFLLKIDISLISVTHREITENLISKWALICILWKKDVYFDIQCCVITLLKIVAA